MFLQRVRVKAQQPSITDANTPAVAGQERALKEGFAPFQPHDRDAYAGSSAVMSRNCP